MPPALVTPPEPSCAGTHRPGHTSGVDLPRPPAPPGLAGSGIYQISDTDIALFSRFIGGAVGVWEAGVNR